MAGYDQNGSYEMDSLEKKYRGFISPTFNIKVGSFKLDSSKIPVSNLEVEITTENKAGTCSFTVEAMYNYETGVWSDGFLDNVDVGMIVTVELGYSTAQKRVFYGYVDRYNISYSSSGAPKLSISAMDGLGLLMADQDQQDFGEKSTTDVVKDLIAACQTEKLIESSKVDTLPTFQGHFVKEKACSNYDFLCRLAEMCFVNFCIIDGQLLFMNLMKNSSPIIELTMGRNLIEFSKSVGFTQQIVGSVTVISTGTPDKQEVRGEANTPTQYGGSDGQTGAEKWKAMGGMNKDIVMNFLRSADECKVIAQNVLDSMTLGFVSGNGRCIGVPELIPGRYVKLSGLDKETNGTYFITDVKHSCTESGYFTEFSVKGFRSK